MEGHRMISQPLESKEMEKVLEMKEINDEELAQVAGGAARKTETRTAKKEVFEYCGRIQSILEWFYD